MKFTKTNKGLIPNCETAKRWYDKINLDKNVELINISATKKRSLEANSKYWKWCYEVGVMVGMETAEVHNYNKWHIGLSILTQSHPEHRDKLLKLTEGMDYEERINAMELIRCTSVFSVSEMRQYMDAVQRHWSEQGVLLD